jgi:REP element-mobilizing transposase RayT
MQEISHRKGPLSVVIGGLKRAVTHYANKNTLDFAWQPRFHDHIIRDNSEMNRIADYIENNVANWVDDEFYTP